MVPKILHMIWLGKLPKYAEMAAEAYQEMNPRFKVHLLHKTVEELERISEAPSSELDADCQAIKSSISACMEPEQSKYRSQISRSRDAFKMGFIQVLADVLRLELLNTFGGLYVDCDTLPMRPFDDKLLSLAQFTVAMHMRGSSCIIPDYWFMGRDTASPEIHSYFSVPHTLLQTDEKWWTNVQHVSNKAKFFKLQMRNVQRCSRFYIEHYGDGTWLKQRNGVCRTPTCKLDFT